MAVLAWYLLGVCVVFAALELDRALFAPARHRQDRFADCVISVIWPISVTAVLYVIAFGICCLVLRDYVTRKQSS